MYNMSQCKVSTSTGALLGSSDDDIIDVVFCAYKTFLIGYKY